METLRLHFFARSIQYKLAEQTVFVGYLFLCSNTKEQNIIDVLTGLCRLLSDAAVIIVYLLFSVLKSLFCACLWTVWDVSSLQVSIISVLGFSHLYNRRLLHFIFRLYFTLLIYNHMLCKSFFFCRFVQSTLLSCLICLYFLVGFIKEKVCFCSSSYWNNRAFTVCC